MAHKILIGVLALAMCCFYRSCSGYDSQQEGLALHVAISPDDREILFSCYKNGMASLYVADVNGGNVRRLTSAKKESHINAVYSSDGSKILFLEYRENRGRPFSNICVMDANGSNLRRLTSGEQYIAEAIFSPDGKTVYYLQSNFFGHYSPIVGSRPHDFDVYSINLDGHSSRQLTSLHEYEIYGLSVTSDGHHLLFGSGPLNRERRPFPFHQLLVNDPNIIVSFEPSGQFGSDIFTELQVSPDSKTAAFVAVAPMPVRLGRNEVGGFKYELYLMDLENRYSKQITNLRRHVLSPCFMRRNPRLIFVVDTMWPDKPPRYELWAVNTDSTGLSKINLNLVDSK